MLHFLLARAARPYSLQTTIFLVSFWLIARLIKQGHWNDLFLLCFANFLLFWLHYFAYYLVAAQGVILALGLSIRSSPFTYRQFAVFCLCTALTAVPVYIWFVLPSLAHQLSGAHLPRQIISWTIGQDLRTASVFVSSEFSWAGLMYLGPLAGWLICLSRKPKFAMLCLLIAGIPFALVLAMAPGYAFSSASTTSPPPAPCREDRPRSRPFPCGALLPECALQAAHVHRGDVLQRRYRPSLWRQSANPCLPGA